jgi:mannose-1-phosphate guanylyltransferase
MSFGIRHKTLTAWQTKSPPTQGTAVATARPGENAMETKKQNCWAIILAGGEQRLTPDLHCCIAGEKTPRQFSRTVDGQSLIEQTRRRVEMAIPKDQIFYTLNHSDERFYVPLLFDALLARLVVQPLNRGTAPAILYALMRLGLVDPNARVALFPCDRSVSDDRLLMRQVKVAFDVIEQRPDQIVVLGIAPTTPEPAYGWIEPASPFRCAGETLFHVLRFVENPPAEVARRMHAYGRCLWNSFVFIARLPNLLALIIRTLPELYQIFAGFTGTLGTEFETENVERTYRAIEPVDFCKSALSTQVRKHLSVLPVSGLCWNDLSNSSRVWRPSLASK